MENFLRGIKSILSRIMQGGCRLLVDSGDLRHLLREIPELGKRDSERIKGRDLGIAGSPAPDPLSCQAPHSLVRLSAALSWPHKAEWFAEQSVSDIPQSGDVFALPA